MDSWGRDRSCAEVADGKRADEFTEDGPDKEAKPYLWEHYFYQGLKQFWESEVDALSLKSLQGTSRFYGAGNPQQIHAVFDRLLYLLSTSTVYG
jgi:hypothetical protein